MGAISALLNPNKKKNPYGIAGVGGVINPTTPVQATPTPVQPKTTPMPTQNNGLPGIAGLVRTAGVKPTGVSSVVNQTQPTQPTQNFTPYKPFEYSQANIEADPVYQAALSDARQNIQTGQNNTLANLVANGQGHSSYADTVTQQIANKEMANVSNNILPSLIEQAYKRHNDQFSNQNLIEQQNYGAGQDAFHNNFDINAQTGTYLPVGARESINNVLSYKQAYADAGTPEERQRINAAANAERAKLFGLGVDPDSIGSNIGFDAASKAATTLGQPTESARQFNTTSDENRRINDRNFNRDVFTSDRNFNHDIGREKIDDTRYTDELLYGRGRDTVADQRYADETTYNHGRDTVADNRADAKANQPEQVKTVSAATAGSLLSQTLKKQVGVKDGKPVYGVVNDPVTRENAFLDVLDSAGITSWPDAVTALTKAGYTNAEINKYASKYNTPENFPGANSTSGAGVSRVTIPQEYDGVITGANSKYGLPDGLLGAVASAESSFNPKAKNKSGASGMFQFMPGTAKGYGIDAYNVDQAADAAGKMLSGGLAKYDGDLSKALAMYNWGGGNLDKAIKQYGDDWLSHAPTETQKYIKKILGG